MRNDSYTNPAGDPSALHKDNTSFVDEINIRDYFSVIRRRKWIIVACFVITVMLITIHSFRHKPVYRATAIIRLFNKPPKILSFDDIVSSERGKGFFETECQILRSRSLAKRVAKSLRLDLHPGSGYILKIVNVRNTELIHITVEAGLPGLCQNVANAFADEYINQSLENKILTSIGARGEVGKQLEELKKKIEVSEKLVYQYARENDILGMDANHNVLLEKLISIAGSLTAAETTRISKEIKFLQIQDSENLSSLPGIIDNEAIANLKTEHTKIMAKYTSELSRVKEDHPTMLKLKAEADYIIQKVNDMQMLIAKIIKAEYQEAIGMEKALRQRLEELKRENNRLEEKSIGYKVLKREVEANTNLYEGMLQRMKEASVTSGIKTTNVVIIDRALLPAYPFKPKRKSIIMKSIPIGLIIGLGFAFFLDYLDNTIKSPDDVEKYLNMPVLGAIGRVDSDSDLQSDRLVSVLSPKSIIAESIRNIRTSLMFSSTSAHKKRVILVTSSTPSEGKSFMSSNLAVAISQTGKKVVLIDADLRKPTLDKYLDASREPGICNALVGAYELKTVIQNSKIPNLSFIPCGPIPPNPSELLGSSEMEQLIEEARENYDWIIIDSPPVSSVTDANILNNMVDGTILVVKAGGTSRVDARKTVSQLNDIQQKVIGIVLNNVDFVKYGYYYQAYYKYKYYKDGYYQEGEEKVG